MNKIVAILLLLIFISSCEKDFVVPEQNASKRMVVNSLFKDGSKMTVYITNSFNSAGSNIVQAVTDAKVELYENDVFKEVLIYTPSDTLGSFGAYKSTLVPAQGKRYKIKATHATYGVVTAEDVVPIRTKILAQTMVQYPTDTLDTISKAVMDIVLKDDGTQDNYFRVNLWYTGTYQYVNDSGVVVSKNVTYNQRPIIDSDLQDSVRDGNALMFSDKGFNGQTKDLRLGGNPVFPLTHYTSLKMWVELTTISNPYYEYYRTLVIYRGTNSNSEPVNVFTNIVNGYGIFAAYDYQSKSVTIK